MEVIHQVKLGTTNGAKIRGVQRAFADVEGALRAPDLSCPASWTCHVDTGVSEEPLGFDATIRGAQNRACAAYNTLIAERSPAADQVALSIGVESGFIDVAPITFTLYNFDVCALFDGTHYYLGMSPGFEYPRRLVQNIFLHRQSFQIARQYITTTADIETQSGLVGELAGGLIDRPEMTRLSVRLALIRYCQRHQYDRWQ